MAYASVKFVAIDLPVHRLKQQHRHDHLRRSASGGCLETGRGCLSVISNNRHRLVIKEERIPEGWGRLSLVCPQESSGAPCCDTPKHPIATSGAANGSLLVPLRLRGVLRPPEKTHSLPVGSSSFSPAHHRQVTITTTTTTPAAAPGGDISNADKYIKGADDDMSGVGSGSGGSTTSSSYSSLRRGIKATTSKLIGVTTVKRPMSVTAFERGGSGGASVERSDPGRFTEGVTFKGKLIGVLEVSEARGDRMCQEALAELKIAVRAAGEHKQRIVISVAMDGIRLTDERTGDCLYHHPVHKISFIAQDITDTRAFGYIFGSPDAGHKFFGIKTEKTASQVVIAMRDLFQVVFERKKKEIEKARAQLEEGRGGTDFKDDRFDPFGGDSFKPGFSPSSSEGFTSSASEIVPPSASKTTRHSTSSAPTPAPLAPPPVSGRSRHDSQKQKMTEFAKFPVDFKNFSSPPIGQISGADRYAVFKEEFQSDVHRRSIGSSVSVDSGKEFDGQWNMGDRTGGGDSLPSEHNQIQPSYDIFTELDPLGTGKVKPFVDKKDFFNDVRKQTTRRLLRGTGDGEESLPHGTQKVPPGVIPPEVSALVASSSLYNTPNPSTISAIKQPATSTHTTPVHGSVLPSFGEGFTDSFVGLSGSRDAQLEGTSSGFADFNRFSDSPRSQRSEFSSGSVIDEQGTSLSVGSLTVALPPESFRDSPPPFSPPPPPHTPPRSHSGSSSPQPSHSQHSPVPHHRLTKQMTLAAPASPKTLPRSHKFPRQSSYETGWDSGTYFTSPRNTAEEAEFSSLTSPRTDGGISPRPRPRSSLSRQFNSGSSTLPLRGSFGKSSFRSTASPTDIECGPFPSDDTNLSYDEAPEPPPRPAHVEPPPLPPKRLPSHITLRPPPRPPPSSEPHYNYINDYDSSPDNAKSPPIPIPARKPRYAEPPCPSSRNIKPQLQTESFQFPRTSHSPTRESSSSTGAVPKNSSRGSTPSKSSTPGKSPRSSQRGLTPESMDLTNTSLDQLAAKLNMPIEQLAKMTVVELAACLAQLQLRGDSTPDINSRPNTEDGYEIPCNLSQSFGDTKDHPSWSASDKFESFEDDDMFARFDAQFPKSPVDAPSFSASAGTEAKFPLGAPVSEDRYAVFRELSTAATKQKSVFDENLLTPQNSVDDEGSEVSSGTFKAIFSDGPQPIHQDSVEQKSSISDEIEGHGDANRPNKDWEKCERVDHECVTVFRSPDISEYENFEPNFECKFEDDFSNATLSERSETPVNSPAAVACATTSISEPSPQSKLAHKSPFTDDFSKMSNSTVFSEAKYGSSSNIRGSNDEKFVSNFNDYGTTNVANGRSSAFSEASTTRSLSERSPFEDDFSDFHIEKQRTVDNSSLDDNVFDGGEERRSKRFERSSKRRSKKGSVSLDTPPLNGSVIDKPPRSPFDDDFSRRTSKYEVLRDMDAERCSPFDDHEDRKSIGSLHSIQEEGRPTLDSNSRRSPYSEVMTPPSYILRNRGPSRVSLGSEGSGDIRHSPFDDNFTPGYENGHKNGSNNSNASNSTQAAVPPTDESRTKPLEGEGNAEGKELAVPNFADFESAFKSDAPTPDKVKEDRETEVRDSDVIDVRVDEAAATAAVDIPDEDEVVFPESETEFRVSAMFPKSETENIFRRHSDPFSDDFFEQGALVVVSDAPDGGEGDAAPGPPSAGAVMSSPSTTQPTPLPTSSASNKDSFWHEKFDNFKFKDG